MDFAIRNRQAGWVKKVVRITIVILIIAMAAGTAAYFLRPNEPTYAGKPLGYWLDRLAETSPGFAPPSPEWETLGTNTIPVLIKALEECDNSKVVYLRKFRTRYWRVIPNFLLRLPKTRDVENMGLNAVLLLGLMREEAQPAIPALIHVLKAEKSATLRNMTHNRGMAAVGLGNIGPKNNDVINALMAATSDPDPQVRKWAARILHEITPNSAKPSVK